ncbi:MAG: SRPBCC domain-containing protein [Rhodobacteraceae bacterium]|nr:SRPBCC domain-containing protein [Paracoccaceae bacterium]
MMKDPAMLPPLRKTIHIKRPPAQAFHIFTDELALWWPLDRHSIAARSGRRPAALSAHLSQGGEIWETDHAGHRHLWGSFASYDAPRHLVLNWHVGREPAQATRIDLQFHASPGGCDATLVHDGWEALADEAAAIRAGYDEGWDYVFASCFARACIGGA